MALIATATAASVTAAAAAPPKVTLTPWCDNSFRVRVAPPLLPPAAQIASAALARSLASKNLTDLPGALIETCRPGASLVPAPGTAVTNGNLAVSVRDDGSLTFRRADTGALLFNAAPSLVFNGGTPGSDGGWRTVEGKAARSCSSSEFDGDLGSAETASECLTKVMSTGRRVNYGVWRGGATGNKGCYACDLTDRGPSEGWELKPAPGAVCFLGPPVPKVGAGYFEANLTVTAGDRDEFSYGLGQGEWTPEGGCPEAGAAGSRIVPLERHGQALQLQQRKFHVTIPLLTSSSGYALLFNMPGYGSVAVGKRGEGGSHWTARAALYLDFWVSSVPAGATSPAWPSLYRQYADATGHAPPLREAAMGFWQSRNRYKSSGIALGVAAKYAEMPASVRPSVLVIDYKNQRHDGDFAPDPACYPSVRALSDGVRAAINATLMFSFWPEVLSQATEYAPLQQRGCLINADLGGRAVDPTVPECRRYLWEALLKPRYFDQGVSAFWLDETDGEGTGGGGDGDYGYNSSFGPPAAYSNLWVNDWLRAFSEPVAEARLPPLLLTRGVWAGGQRHGVVLWSSDIRSSFEQLASQVPQGVHASMSGIPWWTTDVGGYGCGFVEPNDSEYMRELIVRWYQFGAFSPVFRTHGCRLGPSEPDSDCKPAHGSCGYNEIWSYGAATQALLEDVVRMRNEVLLPYIRELAANVSAHGAPTMRPLAYEFPDDRACRGVDDQYMLGPKYLVAPVTARGATARSVVFPKGASWRPVGGGAPVSGGQTLKVAAPLDTILAFGREAPASEGPLVPA